jgi:hypothetical protein
MRSVAFVAVAAVAVLVAGCGQLPGSTAGAVWSLAPDQRVDAETTRLSVLVSRVGCNSGVTGEVQEPDVRIDEVDVEITFLVRPGEPSAADCQGNVEVPYEVVLPEPLGERRLVDGQCASGGDAGGTVWCDPDGVRWDG